MALKVDYVVKETSRNLVRSPWLTIATILCVFVSIVLVGAALLTRSAVSNATQRWQGGVEFVVFMNADASPEQIDAVRDALDENPQVDDFEFLDKDAAYREALDLFGEESPELVEVLTPEDMPSNFKVRPVNVENEVVEALTNQFEQEAGVREVVAANDAIRAIERVTNIVSVGMLLLAIALTIAALVIIGNTIQTAIFARRREIEVMKLVGATNWFIRIPFMLEGIVQGVLGSILGIVGVYGLNSAFDRYIASTEELDLLGAFTVASGDVFTISIVLLIGGIIIGAVASAIAVTFYVNV